MTDKIVIDATSGSVGRIASIAAKESLQGHDVVIVNCNFARITGDPRTTIKKFLERRRRGGAALKGPHFPKSPERVMKRSVRGMLSYKQERGSSALKRVMCYSAVPKEFESVDKKSFKRELFGRAITLKKLSEEL